MSTEPYDHLIELVGTCWVKKGLTSLKKRDIYEITGYQSRLNNVFIKRLGAKLSDEIDVDKLESEFTRLVP